MPISGFDRRLILPLAILLAGSLLQTTTGYSDQFHFGNAWGIDDAYISYRYAGNLAQGHGLVFNPGERVEGYSNLLYVLLMSAGLRLLDANAAYPLSIALNLLFITIAFLVFHGYIKESAGERSATAAALLFALCPSVWIAVASGMETPLVLAVQLGIWVMVERLVQRDGSQRLTLLIVLVILSILARADGFVMPAIAVAYLVFRRRPKAAVSVALTIMATMSVYLLWRYTYYGYPLPNTYYAKVSGPLSSRVVHAVRQLGDVFLFQGIIAYPLAFGFTLVSLSMNAARHNLSALRSIGFDCFFSLGWLLYWLYIGGDHIGDRFLIILALLWIVSFVQLLVPILDARRMIFVILLMILTQSAFIFRDGQFPYTLKKHDCWINLGGFLKDRYPQATIGIDSAGKVPYFSGLHTIDMLGLNDIVIAHEPVDFFISGHNKSDADYLLSRQPELIAAWLDSERMDLHWGLNRQKYEQAGYALRYLVQTSGTLSPTPIVDVSAMDDNARNVLRRQGFHYGVLVRNGVNAQERR